MRGSIITVMTRMITVSILKPHSKRHLVSGELTISINTSVSGLDVLYSLQGQKYEAVSGNDETNVKLGYVKVPLMFTYNSDPARTVSFTGKIGPQLSILSSAKIEDENDVEIVNDAEDHYESVSIGGVASAGAQFRLSPICSHFGCKIRLRFAN
jgi:hypothetical protein